LDEIDIYIQPSRQEGLPRSLIEAMSRGCLCIGSEAGGIPELLESQYIHKTGSGKSLFNRIDEHLHNAYLCERNIEAAKQYDSKLINSKRNSFFLTVREGVE
jgi:glycosyltransferase involved in cell wall biosynthesis